MFQHSVVSSAPYTVNSFVITQREWTRNTLRKRRLISFQAFHLIFQLCSVHLRKLSGSVGFWVPTAWQRCLCSGAARWELIWEVIKTRGFSVISAAMHSCFTQQVTGIAEIDKSPWSFCFHGPGRKAISEDKLVHCSLYPHPWVAVPHISQGWPMWLLWPTGYQQVSHTETDEVLVLWDSMLLRLSWSWVKHVALSVTCHSSQ